VIRTFLHLVLRLGCLLLLMVSASFGQISTAVLEGTVEDALGARIPDARVKLVSGITGAESSSMTSHQGSFALVGIIPGPYSVNIEREGFSTAQISGITLNLGETKDLLIQLRVGPITETVRIDAAEITVDTSANALSTQISGRLAASLPLNGRSFEDIFTLTPGTLTDSPQSFESRSATRGGVAVNGQRSGMNRFFVDGVSANFGLPDLSSARKVPAAGDALALTAMGTTLSLASVDAVQEFKILGSNYSAEYGGAPGGQFSIVTRSGSNEVHGSVFDYVRNNLADGVDWFMGYNQSSPARPIGGWSNHGTDSGIPYNQNDIGGTIAAPLVLPGVYNGVERSFLFLSAETTHVFQPTSYLVNYAPVAELVEMAPEALKPVLNDWIPSNSEGLPDSALAPEVLQDSLPGKESIEAIRLDQKLNSTASAFLRVSKSTSNSQERNITSLTTIRQNDRTYAIGTTQQLRASSSHDLRMGFVANHLSSQTILGGLYIFPGVPFTNLGMDLGVPSRLGPSRAEAYIRIPGVGESAIDEDNGTTSLHQWNIRDTVSIQLGRHFVRSGIDYRRIFSEVNPAPVSIQADFLSVDSLLNNRATDIAITRNEPAKVVVNEFSAFVQDDWKLPRSLTISPGLRWELNPPPHGVGGADAYTLFGTMASPATLQLAPKGTPLWHTSWFSFAPRIGAAWTVNKQEGRELVARAGAGVYFGSDNAAATEAFNALGFSATSLVYNTPIPVSTSLFDLSTLPAAPYTRSEVIAFPRHFQLPYSLQWNVGLEQAIGRSQSLSASWVAAAGRRLVQERRSDVSSVNPNFAKVTWFPGDLSSNYQSLQVKYQRAISPAIHALASWTWSHTIDSGSTDPLFPFTRGNADLDVRHNLQAALSWNQHTRTGNWFQQNILGGWGLDGRLAARTAFPVNLLGNIAVDPATGDRFYSGVDLVPGRPLYLSDRSYPGGRVFNGGPTASSPAFVLPKTSLSGDAPRNLMRGFGNFQLNIALRRELHLHESWSLQFRAEAFNVTNHPDLGYVDPHISDELFGQAQLSLNQSFGSPGSLYQPGGPRSLQLSLRLHF
jgi:hypothetical protein